jgi:hypothetical protein
VVFFHTCSRVFFLSFLSRLLCCAGVAVDQKVAAARAEAADALDQQQSDFRMKAQRYEARLQDVRVAPI